MKKSEVEAVCDLILDELRQPADIQKLFERVESRLPDAAPLLEFLASKDRHHRRKFYHDSEGAWFRVFGWTMAKALMGLGIVSGIVFFLAKHRAQPVQDFLFFVFGASAYYLYLTLAAVRRTKRARAQARAVSETYKDELRQVLKSLVERNGLDPARYSEVK